MKTQSPVLWVIFNRIDCMVQSLQYIREVRPSKLYIAADGPRVNNNRDIDLCEQCRNYALKNIDWDCKIKTLFRTENLGCGRGVSEAISWFFEYEDYGIIIEDDVLVSKDFFKMCDELLPKYSSEERIMQISSFNPVAQTMKSNQYTFSTYPHCWGWATWRRAWRLFDYSMTNWEPYRKSKKYKDIFPWWERWIHTRAWNRIFEDINTGKVLNIWDYQWALEVFIRKGLCIVPEVNLAEHIGFGDDSTNCFDSDYHCNDLKHGVLEFSIYPKIPLGVDCSIVKLESSKYMKDRIQRLLYRIKNRQVLNVK